MLFKSIGKHFFGFVDLHSNLRQIRKFQRSSILLDDFFEIQFIELQIAIVINIKSFLWKMEGLVHQRGVGIVH